MISKNIILKYEFKIWFCCDKLCQSHVHLSQTCECNEVSESKLESISTKSVAFLLASDFQIEKCIIHVRQPKIVKKGKSVLKLLCQNENVSQYTFTVWSATKYRNFPNSRVSTRSSNNGNESFLPERCLVTLIIKIT